MRQEDWLLLIGFLQIVGILVALVYPRYHRSIRRKIKSFLGVRRLPQLGVMHIKVPSFLYQDLLLTADRLQVERGWPEPWLAPLSAHRFLDGGKQGFVHWWSLALEGEGSPQLCEIEVDANRYQSLPSNRLYPITHDGVPLILDTQDYASYGSAECSCQLAYNTEKGHQAAQSFARLLRESVHSGTRFRGKLISLTGQEDILSSGVIKILGRPPQQAPILGEKVEEDVRAALLDFMEHREALKRSGLSTKRGVLLVGPPGTGKTTIVRWLLNKAPDYTALLVRGESPNHIRLVFQLARGLSPSLVLLEDVDLLATNRYQNSLALFLGALMTEMDGVEQNEDVVVVMTSNDPSEMEAALIRRPGRIDRIIDVGCPEDPVRQRLIEHFLPNTEGQPDLIQASAACKGLMPAAIREVVHQASLLCLKTGQVNGEGHPRVDTATLLSVVPRVREQFGEAPRLGLRQSP
jgi:hypothetical protein